MITCTNSNTLRRTKLNKKVKVVRNKFSIDHANILCRKFVRCRYIFPKIYVDKSLQQNGEIKILNAIVNIPIELKLNIIF